IDRLGPWFDGRQLEFVALIVCGSTTSRHFRIQRFNPYSQPPRFLFTDPIVLCRTQLRQATEYLFITPSRFFLFLFVCLFLSNRSRRFCLCSAVPVWNLVIGACLELGAWGLELFG